MRRISEFADHFNAAGVTWSVFRSLPDALSQDPDLSPDNPMFKLIDQPGLGRYPVPSTPMTFESHDRQDPILAPELGAHTEEALAEAVGMSNGEIARLFDAGIVDGPRPGTRRAV